jgi:hypothetical protein
MSAKRFALGLAFALVFAVRVHADTEPGHFIVNLQDDCSNLTEYETNPVCTVSSTDTSAFDGGWGDATFTTEVSDVPAGSPGSISTAGFTTDGSCDTNGDDHDHWFWFWWWPGHRFSGNGCDNDPSIRVDPGGGSSPFPSTFGSINGGGVFDYQDDTPSPFDEVEFITKLVEGEDYTCASTIFAECGFKAIDNNTELEILFWDGSIPAVTEVPEPASLVLLFGCIAVAGIHRVRSGRRRR